MTGDDRSEGNRLIAEGRLRRAIRDDLEAHPASTSAEVARRLGIEESEVRSLVPTDLRRLLLNEAYGPDTTWSDDDIRAAVADAATYEWPLRAAS